MTRNKTIIIIIIAIIAVVFLWFLTKGEEPVACTMDAKLCSDGSYVGRVPPDCNFAPCPKEDLIQVETPRANEVISSPLIVKGKARGFWFFEADFPVILTDWDGRIIAEGYATAKGEWMTEDFVAFEGALEFEKPEIIGEFAKRGALILQKDNPSGLPEHDDALEFTIFFEAPQQEAEEILKEVTWNQYTNSSLGFLMKTPSEVYGLYKCPAKETIWTPVGVFEDNKNGIVYISQEYYHKAEWDSGLKEYVGPCEKITYSLASLRSGAEESYSGKPLLGWAVFVKDVEDESELDEFVKEQYGPGCSVGDKQPWEQQNGVYEFSVLADGTNLGNTTCPIGWANRIKVLYAPEKNKFMSVVLGQECTFLELHQCYDEEMINSFRFE